MAKAKNRSLLKAKITKNDEFYTRDIDIENELKYYRHISPSMRNLAYMNLCRINAAVSWSMLAISK